MLILIQTNNNLSNMIPSTKSSYSMNNLPKLRQSSTKDEERATILEWFNSLPNYSYGMATMHTNNSAGFFGSGGTRLLSAYRSQEGNYGGIFILPYWKIEGPAFATIENGVLSDLYRLALKDDLTTVSEAIIQPSLNGVTFSSWTALAERCGNMVTLSFNIAGTMKAVSDFILLGTLNVKYRPLKQHFQTYTTQTGKPMTLKIDPNGQFSLFNNNIEVSGFFLRQTISYPAE